MVGGGDPFYLKFSVYVAPKAPWGGSKTQTVQNLNTNLR